MEALEAILTRRSTRKYQEKMPARESIEKVIEAGRFAPSGSNSQNTHFIVFTDRKMLEELAELVRKEFSKMEAGPDTYVSLRNAIKASKTTNYVFHYGAPVFIVVANKKNYGNAMADSACALEKHDGRRKRTGLGFLLDKSDSLVG
ncbi:MAG: nitroreductase family protein [Treponema sp.]|nr:nitroreductase family protein [Treponema sp.]